MVSRSVPILGAMIVVIVAIVIMFVAGGQQANDSNDLVTTEVVIPEGQEVATFAGGCFWCVEAKFQETKGVLDVVSGYAGGQEENPTYEDVYMKKTGHRESIQIFYDPEIITYSELLDYFWVNIDPTDSGGQFVDRGKPYTTAIFYHNEDQRKIAEESKQALIDNGYFESVATEIIEFTTFYEAEEYHQDFYLKSPQRYNSYESNSGREEFKEQVWEEILKQQ